MLLESFSKQVEEIVNEVDTLVVSSSTSNQKSGRINFSHAVNPVQANVHQTQDVIELILDSSRNSLLTLDLQVSCHVVKL